LPARRRVPELGRIAPSGRSVLIGLALLVAAAAAYAGARETSVFAVRTVDVRGGTPALRAEVKKALATEVGTSLLRVDGGAIGAALAPLPDVQSFAYDRAFPHTLRVVVRPEAPVLVLRQSTAAYLVAASGKVVRTLAHPRLSSLPRLWVTKDLNVQVGETLPPTAASAASALALLRGAPLPGGVHEARAGKELTLVLGGGLEVRLGDTGDLRLKLAIARRILRATAAAATGGGYLDVSVPERPVLATKSQVAG
jgi:cell division septal protein FtsQ